MGRARSIVILTGAAAVLLGLYLAYETPTERGSVAPPAPPASSAPAEREPASLSAPETVAPEVAGQDVREAVESVPAAPQEAARVESASVVERATRVTGRCVDESARGIGGVEVRCAQRDATTLSEADGSFELALDPGESLSQSFRFQLRRSGFGSYDLEALVRAGETTHLGDVPLHPTGIVSGRVVDAAGLPFYGAAVRVEEALSVVQGSRFEGPAHALVEGRTGEDGDFRLEDVPSGAIRVWAGVEGMLWTSTDALELGPHEELDVVLEVQPREDEDTIELVVVDPFDTPVPHADVHYRYTAGHSSGSGSSSADEEGRYRKFLDVRVPHSFMALDPESRFRPAFARAVAPGTHDLVLRLAPAAIFTLVVRDAKDAPVERFRAFTLDAREEYGRTDATLGEGPHAGGVVEVVLPVFPFEVRIEAPGYDLAELGPFDPERMPDPVVANLTALPAVRGRVTTADGRIVAGGRVSLHEAIPADDAYVVNGFPCRSGRNREAEARTDEDGRFAITLRKAGSYWVRAEASGLAPADVGPFEIDPKVGADGLDVVMVRGGTLRGRVLVYPDEEASGLIVGLSRADGFGTTKRADANGEYRFDGLTPGAWLLEWRHEEISTRSITSSRSSAKGDEASVEIPWNLEIHDGETTVFDLDLRSTRASLVGRILLSGSAPPDWTADLSPEDGPAGRAVSASVDSRGGFRLTASSTGVHALRVRGMLANTSFVDVRDTVDLEAGESSWELDVPVGSIEGRIPPSLVLPGSSLEYSADVREGVTFSARIAIGADGSFAIPSVPAGPGEIAYRGPDDARHARAVDVVEGEALVLDLP